jgi:very-short-patch-repair endonuclease
MAKFIKKRDRGVCAICGLDCEALKKELRRLEKSFVVEDVALTGSDWESDGFTLTEAAKQRLMENDAAKRDARKRAKEAAREFKTKHGIPPTRKRLWDIDHILPVVEGGGSCDPSNLRVLCLKCHKQETSKLRTRLYSNRYRVRLEQKASDQGWSFPEGFPALATDNVLVRCHKHIKDVNSGDPSVHPDGYYEWSTNSNTLSRDDRGCPHCSNKVPASTARAEWFALKAGYHLIEGQYITSSQQKCWVQCLTCKNTTSEKYKELQQNRKCRVCGKRHAQLTQEHISLKLSESGFTLVEAQARGNKQVVTYVCHFAVRHTQDWDSWCRNNPKRCPCKKSTSTYEHVIKQLSEWYTNRPWDKISTRRIRELTGEKVVPKEFDLFDTQTQTAIEVDGELHRRTGYGRLKDVQVRDAEKDAFCLKVGWKLIRINTDDMTDALKGNTLAEWFGTVFHEQPVSPISEFVLAPFTSDRATVNSLRCSEAAKLHGGKFLTQQFMGWGVDHEWLCAVHGTFVSTPNSVVCHSYWCKPCGYTLRSSGVPKELTFDPAERAREKQASRDADAQASADGTKTREDLRRENGAFAFPNARIDFDGCKKLG